MITFSWILLIALIGGILALVDGIRRLSGNSKLIGIIETVVAALFLVSLFLPGIPFGTLALAVATIIVLVIALVVGRRSRGIAIAALVVLVVWVVLVNHWIVIPGIR
ncbi:hypothetical protein LK09_14830 [Microbacterium mangrovi]|uniref:Uncharacterized protein n=1 Tax=Microbacterium mangrovi TaxID=1348253 RepID=A0A0B2A0Q6_9MICO|nr:hypothetical protein [Microbacterium mangrovi]KHK96601.1 hypothetical protein LK09_14830 [Microbacterium mangrovi]